MKTSCISVALVACCISGLVYAQEPSKSSAELDEVISLDTPDSAESSENGAPCVPERLLDDSHMNEELGVNEFTAPSIKKIFENLEGLPPIPDSAAVRARSERLPMDRCSLALQLGGLMADGFIIVQCGKMNEVKPIALDLSKYAKAIGAGERVNRHAASLLQDAEEGNLTSFKENLALTQTDVEKELASLRDSDMAHLIGLGGWIRALDAATAALEKKFTQEQSKVIFQPDVPEYFAYILDGVEPEMKDRRDISQMIKLLKTLESEMTLKEGEAPTPAKVEQIRATTQTLMKIAIEDKK